MLEEADYVILGGGSAGSVLANRLSADPAVKVVLIEAGGTGKGFWVDMPVGIVKLLGDERVDWCYSTEPDPTINGRQLVWSAGKMLGGSGGLNGMVYMRGQRGDYRLWEESGCTGWSFDDVLPYYMRSEHWEGDGDFQSHGRTGPLSVSHQGLRGPMVSAFLQSAAAEGIGYLEDPMAGSIDGAFHVLTTRHQGRRCSPAKAFIEPVRNRSNLKIFINTLADRIVFEDERAVGVRVRRDDQCFEVRAKREIIVSAGGTQSPVVLMRSGIGPAERLRSLGIPVVVDRPAVGANLMEHPLINRRWLVDVPTFNTKLRSRLDKSRELLRYVLRRESVFNCSPTQAMAGVKTLPGLDEPDVLLFFSSFVFDSSKPPLHPGKAPTYPLLDRSAAAISAFVNRPYSRGTITLRSSAPEDRPVIEPGLLSDERDVETLVRAGKLIERLFAAPGLADRVVDRLDPLSASDDEWRAYVRRASGISWHASGTCRMGGDDDAVVDPRLKVRGVDGLRVADASIMPVITSGNTNAPAMMIGERAAAMIQDDAR